MVVRDREGQRESERQGGRRERNREGGERETDREERERDREEERERDREGERPDTRFVIDPGSPDTPDFGFRVLGLGVWGLGFGVWGFGIRVSGNLRRHRRAMSDMSSCSSSKLPA